MDAEQLKKLPQAFQDKIAADALLSVPVISMEDGRKAVKAVKRARMECQAHLKPSEGSGRTA